MLNVFFYSFLTAVICTILVSGVSGLLNGGLFRIGVAIGIFVMEFSWLIVMFYIYCIEQIPSAFVRWMWPPLIAFFVISGMASFEVDKEEIIAIILAGLSILVAVSGWFTVEQNLLYAHDMKDADITYAVSSNEILTNVELKMSNALWQEKYEADSPEMRNVQGENIAVYHISDKTAESGGSETEYIPGYFIQRENEIPELISARIYFDTSYTFKWDALRKVRREYPTFIIGEHKFDIDDDWNPYEIFEYREKYYSTNGEDYGIITLDLRDGTCKHYKAKDVPKWVDFKTTEPK